MTEKRYSHDGVVIIDHLKKDLIHIDGKEGLLELAEYVDKLQDENEQLKQQKEVWKQICCSNSNFNSILLHELDIAREQGYEVSNPFKQFLEDREDVK